MAETVYPSSILDYIGVTDIYSYNENGETDVWSMLNTYSDNESRGTILGDYSKGLGSVYSSMKNHIPVKVTQQLIAKDSSETTGTEVLDGTRSPKYSVTEINGELIDGTNVLEQTVALMASISAQREYSRRMHNLLRHYGELYNVDESHYENDSFGADDSNPVEESELYSTKIYSAGKYRSMTKTEGNCLVLTVDNVTYYGVPIINAYNISKNLEIAVVIRGIPVKMLRFNTMMVSSDGRYNAIFRFPEYMLTFKEAVESIEKTVLIDYDSTDNSSAIYCVGQNAYFKTGDLWGYTSTIKFNDSIEGNLNLLM